jgi:hypothetical protein
MVPNPTSYICERSAEYALIPELVSKFKTKYEFVTPIYPWISREGSNISRSLHGLKSFKILGLYARRPKLLDEDDPFITVKFSEQIIYGGHMGFELGIPMIAGCPLARNFFELSTCKNFLWADLSKFSIDDIDIQISVDKDGKTSEIFNKFLIHKTDDVIDFVELTSESFDLEMFIQAIKKIKMTSKGYGVYYPMAFMGGYKPVYFLLANS